MLLNQVIHDEAPSPRKLQSSIPKDLETITLKCLEKLPEKRYQTCQEFANDLQAWLDHKPIKARPVGQLGKLLRWRKRNPVVANLSGGIAIVLLLSAALSINFALTAQNEAELARQARDKATASEAAAIRSQNEAIEQKEKAEASEQNANRATQEADLQRGIAESKVIEAGLAQARADEERKKAEGQREIAEELKIASQRQAYTSEMLGTAGLGGCQYSAYAESA
jgi:hypothetical protein